MSLQQQQWTQTGQRWEHETAKCRECHGPIVINIVGGERPTATVWDVDQYDRCERCVQLDLFRMALARWDGDVRKREPGRGLPKISWTE